MVSLGCDKNRVDTERILGALAEAGHGITPDPAEADAIVVNTCAFISRARRESVDAILEMAAYKKSGRLRYLIVSGCLPQLYTRGLAAELPEADAFIGADAYGSIGEILKRLETGERFDNFGQSKTPERIENFGPPETTERIDNPRRRAEQTKSELLNSQFSILNSAPVPAPARVLTTPTHYAYLKIAEGCGNRCTYCTIPRIKGGYRSFDFKALTDEAKGLADGGVKELILVAQDTARYGTDRGEPAGFLKLLDALSGISGIEWIRLMYLYPEFVGSELIRQIAQNPKIAKYADIPLQHASDRVLKSMGRRTGGAAARRLIESIRAADENISIRSTFIVGFPGETGAEFEELSAFLRDCRLDNAGFFAYSREAGTPAAAFPDQVPAKVIRERLRAAQLLQQGIALENHKRRIGRTVRFLCDGAERGRAVGRAESDAPEIDTFVYLKGSGFERGGFYDVRITGVRGYDLVGELRSAN
jgi:ribosomal protein S12 methylthiotransferase